MSGLPASWPLYATPSDGPYVLPGTIPYEESGDTAALYWEHWTHPWITQNGNQVPNPVFVQASLLATNWPTFGLTPTPAAYWGTNNVPSAGSATWSWGMPIWFVNALNMMTFSAVYVAAHQMDPHWKASQYADSQTMPIKKVEAPSSTSPDTDWTWFYAGAIGLASIAAWRVGHT